MQYKLYTNSVASGNGVTSLKIVRKGRLKAIYFDLNTTGGAGVGRIQLECSKQNTVNTQTNDAPPTVLGSASIAVGNALTAAENVAMPTSVDVDAGDNIYINETVVGTAPATFNGNIYLVVE